MSHRRILALACVCFLLSALPVFAQGPIIQGSDPATGRPRSVQTDGAANLRVGGSHSTGFNCLVPVSTATTLTAVGGSCATPGTGLSLYITGVSFGSSAASSTAADAFPTLKSGTGGTCGTGTAVVWSAMSVANTTVIDPIGFEPIKVAANSELCWIHSVAGSKVVRVTGFIAP